MSTNAGKRLLANKEINIKPKKARSNSKKKKKLKPNLNQI